MSDARKRQDRVEDPPRIPDTLENIARAIMLGPPKDGWQYLDDTEDDGEDDA